MDVAYIESGGLCGVVEFSHICLVSVLFVGPSLPAMKFFSETFSP